MRTRFTLRMTVASALHVGTGRGDAIVDDTIMHDVAGRPIIPGTTLAGSLRALAARIDAAEKRNIEQKLRAAGATQSAGDDAAEKRNIEHRLWGSTDAASPVVVEDAVVDLGGRGIGTRAGIAIDRHTGTVTDGALFEHSIVPAGACFELELETDDAELRGDILDLLGVLRGAGLELGRATSRGMGRVVVADEVVVSSIDLGDPEQLARLVSGDPPASTERVPLVPRLSPGVVRIEIEWSSPVPVLSRDPQGEGKVDDLPLLLEVVDDDSDAGRFRLAIAGSSLKGALRTHAERIVRTVTGTGPATEGDPLDRLKEDLQVPLVDRLFGSAKVDGGGRRGAMTVRDCVSVGSVDPDELARLDPRAADQRVPVRITDGDGQQQGEVLVAHHVAIDRWTGGAVAGALFDVAEARGVRWGPIVLDVDTDLLFRDLPGDIAVPRDTTDAGRAAEGLLVLVLEDLAAGRIPLGGLVTRGRGTVRVHAIRWGDSATWSTTDADIADRSPSDGWTEPAGGPVASARAAWISAWQDQQEAPR